MNPKKTSIQPMYDLFARLAVEIEWVRVDMFLSVSDFKTYVIIYIQRWR
jgi:hypothetical protein